MFTKTISQQSSQHIVRSHPWGQDHAAYSSPWHSDDHNPFSHSHSGCGILDKWFEMQKRCSSENTGSFPVSCYWIKPLLFVLLFIYISQTLEQKLFQTCLKDLGITMSQVKFGCLRWTSRLGTLCNLLLPDLKNTEIKTIPSSPNPP